MYWATGRKIRTESRELRQAVEEEMEDDDGRAELAEIIREQQYEFVGAYPHGAIPQHVGAGAVEADALLEATEHTSPQETVEPDGPPPAEALIRSAPAEAKPLLEGLLGNY